MRSLSRDLLPLALAGSLVAIAFIAPSRAAEKIGLAPAEARTISLGYVRGSAYYTVERDGYRVVATLSVGGGAPVRVSTTLQPEQAMSVSVPGAEGTAASLVEIARRGDTVVVSDPARLVLN